MFLDDTGINLIRQLVKIEEGAEEHDDGEDDDNASHHTIDDKDAGVVKLASHLVDKPRQSSVTRNAVTPLCTSVPFCVLLLLWMLRVGLER